MSIGRVTFIVVTPTITDSLPWRARQAISEADIVIWANGAAPQDELRAAPAHADIVITDARSAHSMHSLLPFYDLASRDGFRVAHIRSGATAGLEDILDHIDRCDELGLATELVR